MLHPILEIETVWAGEASYVGWKVMQFLRHQPRGHYQQKTTHPIQRVDGFLNKAREVTTSLYLLLCPARERTEPERRCLSAGSEVPGRQQSAL